MAATGASVAAAVKTRWHSRPLDPVQRGGSRFAPASANTDLSTKAVRIRRRGASVVVMPRRRKTASSRVSGLLRTQRRYRRAFSLPPVRMWARRTAQTRSSGIFLKSPAVFCYFWNETASTKTAGLSPAAAPGPVGRRSEHAFTSWVCAQAVKNAQTAAFRVPISVFWGHISAALRRGSNPPSGLRSRGKGALSAITACYIGHGGSSPTSDP